MKYVSRANWGAKPPKAQPTPLSHGALLGMAVHYEAVDSAGVPHDKCDDRVRQVQRFHQEDRGWNDIAYCVDDQTEILTQAGWKTYDLLSTSDFAYTLNHQTGAAEWQPVQDVCVFRSPPGGREMVLMEGSQHSSLTTPNHRWPVERRLRSTGSIRQRDALGRWAPRAAPAAPTVTVGFDRRFVTTETLGYWDRIPIAAPCADLPEEPKYSDSLVEAVAWFWTEGHILKLRSGEPSRSVSITQSWEKNPQNVTRIALALESLFGPAVESFPRLDAASDGVPRWRSVRNAHKQEFYLSVDAGAVLQSFAPDRVPARDFLLNLTRSQLELFISVSMLADNNGARSLAQKNRAAAEAFQFAVTLSGRASSLRPTKPGQSTPYPMWKVELRTKTHFSPGPAKNNPNGSFRIEKVILDGVVWCPRTENQTWLARRNGSVYFTGNTWLVCRHGYIYEGRGWDIRTAAQGTNHGNDSYHAVCYLDDDRPDTRDVTPEAASALAQVINECRATGRGSDVRPHQFFFSTACPGPELVAWIKARGWETNAPPPASPKPQHQPHLPAWYKRVLSLKNPMLRGHDVINVQNAVKAAPDGVYGPATAQKVRGWQRTHGLAADGVVGPLTAKAMHDAHS